MHEYTRAVLTCGGDIELAASILQVEPSKVWNAWLEDNSDASDFFNALRQYALRNQIEVMMRSQEKLLEKIDEMGAGELVHVLESSVKHMTHFLGLAPASQAINFNFSNGNLQDDAGMLSWVRQVAKLRGWDEDDAVAEATRILSSGDNGSSK